MNKFNGIPIVLKGLLFFILPLTLFSCREGKKDSRAPETTVSAAPASSPVIGSETSLLLSYLASNGDYVNSQDYPSLIKATIVHEELGKKNHVIDLRSSNEYGKGHIKGAVNKRFEELPEYFEAGIKPFEFDKIILVCEDGQVSSYATCLLRLMGYGNVYAMRWGMSAWNRVCASPAWLKGVSGDFEDRLETTVHEKPEAAGMPEPGTGKGIGEEISSARFHKLFSEGTAGIFLTAGDLFRDPSQYFIINLERKDKYEDGHIPGAFRYKPEQTLSYPSEMATIPAGKPVVVYCGTGHNSSFATAYLRLFGYDAKTLRYGNNSFMYEKMKKERVSLSWLPFSDADINSFELVK